MSPTPSTAEHTIGYRSTSQPSYATPSPILCCSAFGLTEHQTILAITKKQCRHNYATALLCQLTHTRIWHCIQTLEIADRLFHSHPVSVDNRLKYGQNFSIHRWCRTTIKHKKYMYSSSIVLLGRGTRLAPDKITSVERDVPFALLHVSLRVCVCVVVECCARIIMWRPLLCLAIATVRAKLYQFAWFQCLSGVYLLAICVFDFIIHSIFLFSYIYCCCCCSLARVQSIS